ncbi:unnamed protein product [Urochloa humidicola]
MAMISTSGRRAGDGRLDPATHGSRSGGTGTRRGGSKRRRRFWWVRGREVDRPSSLTRVPATPSSLAADLGSALRLATARIPLDIRRLILVEAHARLRASPARWLREVLQLRGEA